MYICNAFSIQMLPPEGGQVTFTPISPAFAGEMLSNGAQSAIGHADTAAVVSDTLGMEVPSNRAFVALKPGDEIIVAQLTGGRLPEGSITLPEGFEIAFFHVTIG